jgi:hypothetical protein
MLAAVLRRYPYGASCRLSQHVAPAVCLLAGVGAAALLERLRSPAHRRRWVLGICGLLAAIAVGGMARDLIKPYRDLETRWMYEVMREVDARARSGAVVVVLNDAKEMDPLFRWHLGLYGERLAWDGQVDWDRAAASGEVVCVRYRWHLLTSPDQMAPAPSRGPAEVPASWQARLDQSGRAWVLREAVSDTCVPPSWRDPVKHLDRFHWVLERGARKEGRPGLVSRRRRG